MLNEFWRTEGKTARIELPPLSGRLDIERLAAGVGELSIGGKALELAPHAAKVAEGHFGVSRPGLLGLELPSEAGGLPKPSEWFARGQDMVVWFSAGTALPVEVQAIWRAVPGGQTEAFAAAVDLIVGVRTQRLEAEPRLSVVSRLPAREVIPVPLAEAGPSSPWLWAAEGPPAPAFLFRIGGGWGYVEMVHPATRLESSPQCRDFGAAELRHRLFAQPAEKLEKGVMLRAWIRGALVPEKDDMQRARSIYAAFAASEPPLGA